MSRLLNGAPWLETGFRVLYINYAVYLAKKKLVKKISEKVSKRHEYAREKFRVQLAIWPSVKRNCRHVCIFDPWIQSANIADLPKKKFMKPKEAARQFRWKFTSKPTWGPAYSGYSTLWPGVVGDCIKVSTRDKDRGKSLPSRMPQAPPFETASAL